MAAKLTPGQIAFLREAHIAHVATVYPSGAPHVTPIWVDTDGEAVLVNTSLGRVKPRNLSRDPRIAISIADEADIYRRLVIRGRAELTEEGATEHINFLNQKYHGQPNYPLQPGERRVIVRIVPEHISGNVS
ncbi:MAG: PPOX class F420-dependent oxidoreductase [Candidatus Dormibacteria bacterium]